MLAANIDYCKYVAIRVIIASMSDPLDLLQTTLKQHHQSLTQPRLLVFEALQNQEPQTMQQLVTACQGRIDRASVYRTVGVFEKLGIVQRLQIGWKYKLELSGDFHHHHHHLTCRNCGTTIPLPADNQLEARLHDLAKQAGFLIQGHQLEVQGLCQNCQRQLSRSA